MDHELLDEHEREDMVRKWIKENVPVLIVGASLGLAGVFGWRYYQEHLATHRQQAAAEYAHLAEKDSKMDPAHLETEYADTPYAALAAMAAAKSDLSDKSLDEAVVGYRKTVKLATNPGLKLLAKVRLSKLLTASGKPGEALKVLHEVGEPTGFVGLINEMKGDAYQAQGDRDQAIEAYRQALATLDPASGNRRNVEMKLEDLGVPSNGVSG